MAESKANKPGIARTLVQSHLTSLGGAATFVFLLIKAYAVSGFSVTTTLGVIATAPVQVLLGSAAFYVYPLMPVACVALAMWWLQLLTDGKGTPVGRAALLGGAIVAAILSPQFYLPIVAGLVLLFLVVTAMVVFVRCQLKGEGATFGPTLRDSARRWGPYAIALVSAGALLVSLQSMWLPAEVLTFEKDAPTIGYVLAQDGDSVTFLRASDRALIRVPATEGTAHIRHLEDLNDGTVPTSAITGRQICHWKSPIPFDEGPLLYLLQQRLYHSPNLLCSRILCHVHRLAPDLPLNSEPLVVREILSLEESICDDYLEVF